MYNLQVGSRFSVADDELSLSETVSGAEFLARRAGRTPAVSIRIAPGDLSRARAHAARKGLRYQTYLKMLLHEALDREDKLTG